MNIKDKPNKVTAKLRVIVTGEFYDDDASEETLRYCVEQDLEDAGFDVDVALLKEQEAVEPRWFIDAHNPAGAFVCSACGERIIEKNIDFYCSKCGKPITWAKMEGR